MSEKNYASPPVTDSVLTAGLAEIRGIRLTQTVTTLPCPGSILKQKGDEMRSSEKKNGTRDDVSISGEYNVFDNDFADARRCSKKRLHNQTKCDNFHPCLCFLWQLFIQFEFCCQGKKKKPVNKYFSSQFTLMESTTHTHTHTDSQTDRQKDRFQEPRMITSSNMIIQEEFFFFLKNCQSKSMQ